MDAIKAELHRDVHASLADLAGLLRALVEGRVGF